MLPLNGQKFTGAHAGENSKPEYHLLPVFDRTKSEFNLVSGHGLALASFGGFRSVKGGSGIYRDYFLRDRHLENRRQVPTEVIHHAEGQPGCCLALQELLERCQREVLQPKGTEFLFNMMSESVL